MKTKIQSLLILLICLIMLHSSFCPCLHAQGTAFTYQGRLDSGTNPAAGSYDFTFAVFNAATGGAQSGVTLTNPAIAVSNGLFTTMIDFGGIFSGTNYWLAVGVRTNGNGAFTALSPRQPLTPVPYAIYAPNAGTSVSAGTAGTADNVASGSVTGAGIAAGQVVKSLNGLHDAVALESGVNITLSTAGNTLIISGSGSGGGGTATNAWNLTGNAGTTPGVNFIGTTDNQALELKVDGQLALYLKPTYLTNTPDLIGGSSLNSASGVGDTVAGGYGNTLSGSYGFIGSGTNCVIYAGTDCAFIAGGAFNSIASFSQFTAIGGGDDNTIGNYSYYSTIGGGASNFVYGASDTVAGGALNQITNNTSCSMIGGGQDNVIGGAAALANAAIAGGFGNTVNASDAFIGGGDYNIVYESGSVIAGGISNVVNSGDAEGGNAVGGGLQNTVGGGGATVPGGENNRALGMDSFAAGAYATAFGDHSFVWATGGAGFADTGNNQFLMGPNVSVGINTNNPQSALDVNGTIHASGSLNADYGMVVGNNKVILNSSGTIQAEGNISTVNNMSAYTVNATTIYASSTVYANGVALTSDRNAKENFKPLDSQAVLARVASLPVTEWNYKTDQVGVQHIGPMAQDFHAAFQLDGADDKHISVVDEGGVALAAIQGLNQKVESENSTLRAENEELRQSVDELKAMVRQLAARK
jgi:hypothetical protein